MTLAEQSTKLTELIQQLTAIESAIIDSGLDDDLIKDALEDVSEARGELKVSRRMVQKQQRTQEAA